MQGAGHCDMYDEVPYIDEAVEKLAEFFDQRLSPLDRELNAM